MPRANDERHEATDRHVTVIIDTSDATYDYTGYIPRGEVVKAGSLAAAQALEVAYIERTTKVNPVITQTSSTGYNQIWDNRAAATYY